MKHMNIEDFLYLETIHGVVIIKMFPNVAPQHVKQILELIKIKFYNGLTFHRVIDGFMVQGGCPNGTGSGGVTPTIPLELSELTHKRGICSMARTSEPNSASCQFFICLADTPSLDGQYSIWGQVVKGMEFIDAIKKGDPNNNGIVTNPDGIISMKSAMDISIKYVT